MSFLTYSEINAYKQRGIQRNLSASNVILEKQSVYVGSHVFLSHSSLDKDKLDGVVSFLYNFGTRVYIDKLDNELPLRTSPETGDKLKKRIAECSKFIVLVSPNSKESKWIPWELGFADENKSIENIALFPIIPNGIDALWVDQEYMGLYSRIEKRKFADFDEPQWIVLNQHMNTGTLLSEWLNK